MPNKMDQAFIPITGALAEQLMQEYPPYYANVFCQRVTLAHGAGLPSDLSPKTCVVYGMYDNPRLEVQSLLLTVDGEFHRPDGRLFWITQSLGHGVKPISAGVFGSDQDQRFIRLDDFGYEFVGRPTIRPARVLAPRSKSLAA